MPPYGWSSERARVVGRRDSDLSGRHCRDARVVLQRKYIVCKAPRKGPPRRKRRGTEKMPGLSTSFSPPISNSQLASRVKVCQDASEHRGCHIAMRGLEKRWNECYVDADLARKGLIGRDGSANSHTRSALLNLSDQPKSIRDVRYSNVAFGL